MFAVLCSRPLGPSTLDDPQMGHAQFWLLFVLLYLYYHVIQFNNQCWSKQILQLNRFAPRRLLLNRVPDCPIFGICSQKVL